MDPDARSGSQGDTRPAVSGVALAALCAAKLLLHVFTSVRRYGYFRDELYFLDMARHLDWGYVDSAPLIAVYAKVATLLGGSLAAVRFLPALAGTALIALSVLLARELGGGRFAQVLTGLCVLLCPGFLLSDSLLTMNAFEPLYWTGCILILARILRTGNSRLWIGFGVLAGLGIENKHSTLFFGFAVTTAIVLTRERREFARPWIWAGGAIAAALFLPNLIWQIRHHFPTLEDLENVRREGKNVVLSPLAFVKEQILDMHPLFFPVWLAGVVSFLRSRRFRVLGLVFLVLFGVMEIAHAKSYYLFSIYPMAFAGGGVAFEKWLSGRAAWTRLAVAGAVVLVALPVIPLATWMLAPERYIAYTRAIGFRPSKSEVHHDGPLPQPMGDQFGWPGMVREVAAIYRSLPPEERVKTGIFANNYGESGAIDLFGPALGLPRAWSRHQNYWYWGPPEKDYRNLIVLQGDEDDMRRRCTSFEAYPHFDRNGMAEENTPIYLCRGLTVDLRKIWPDEHHWN
ncbi:MAG: ArnT family glycosyltransferase [Thermoanaerobaculia bacterium]